MASSNAQAHTVSDSHGDAHIAGGSAVFYFWIFVALLVLLAISVVIAYIPVTEDNRSWLTLVGFLIAGTKAILVIFFFMHVWYSSRLTWLFSLGSFFFLLIMVWLTMNDYATRIPVVYQPEGTVQRPVEPSGQAEGYREPVNSTLRAPKAPDQPERRDSSNK
jgi:cytochrome c oxidase subunit 4